MEGPVNIKCHLEHIRMRACVIESIQDRFDRNSVMCRPSFGSPSPQKPEDNTSTQQFAAKVKHRCLTLNEAVKTWRRTNLKSLRNSERPSLMADFKHGLKYL